MSREGITIARCTVERLMKRIGLHGVRRGKVVRTTIQDKAVPCPLDKVNRQFKAERPNQLWVSDSRPCTRPSTRTRRCIDSPFRQRVPVRPIMYSERLAQAGIEPSVGSRGDSYDNALAETINGLYKSELIHRRAPWKTKESVELATLEWVSWFNHHRLLESIGYIPPAEAEAEANYYRQLAEKNNASALT